jgi:hypothetical protein
VALSPQANYTDWATATWRNLVSTFVDRGVSRGQRGGSPMVVNLGFLDRQTSQQMLIIMQHSEIIREPQVTQWTQIEESHFPPVMQVTLLVQLTNL